MLIKSQVAPGKPELFHNHHLSDPERLRLHGSCWQSDIGPITPGQLTAGELTTVEFEFQIGQLEVACGGKLCVCWRWPLDWGDLQTLDSAAEGYLKVKSPGGVKLDAQYHWLGGVEPWHHYIELILIEGSLQPEQKVRLVCGETSGGGAPWRAPTSISPAAQFLTLIDHDGSGRWMRLVDPPSYRLVAGAPRRLVALAPSDASVDCEIEVIVRAEDRWGNPTSPFDTPPALRQVDDSSTVKIQLKQTDQDGPPVTRYGVTFSAEGSYRLEATLTDSEDGGMTAMTNAVLVSSQPPELGLFWGDLHSGQTEIGCGHGSLEDHYTFGRDVAGLQFITHQANDHYVTRQEWDHTRAVTDAFYEPGRYVPLLGCEWSPPTRDGGDRNVFYLRDEPRLRRSGRYFTEDHEDPEPDIPTAPEFHAAFADREVLVNIHVGGRPTNLQWYDGRIERLAETHSTHGTSQWFLEDVLQRGYRVGVTAGTDGVMGRPGACQPGERLIRNLPGGLTAVYAKELTRESLWEALKQRRCYATTGARIRLWSQVNGQPMGAICTLSKNPRVSLTVEGTEGIEQVDFYCGAQIIHTWLAPMEENDGESKLVRVIWSGSESRGTARLQKVDWDGALSVEGGRLELLSAVGYQAPCDELVQQGATTIRWKSKTAGNSAGALLRVFPSKGSSPTLSFQSGPASFTAGLDQVQAEPMSVEAGGVDRRVTIGPPPRAGAPRSLRLDFEDKQPRSQTAAYWVRVIQTDQQRAWSSPVYVTRSSAERS